VGNAATAGKWVNKGAKAAKGISESAQKANKGLLGNVKEKVNKQVANAKTQIQARVDEVKQQLRQLGAPQMEFAGVNVGRMSDTGTVGKNTSSSSPKPSNSQPPQNSSNKKPAENKGTGNSEIKYPLSSTNKKHINKHNIESIKQQSKYLSDSQLADKLESSFFNPKWSQEDKNKYAEIAYNDLKNQGKTGNLTYEIGGEIIDVFIHPDGQFGSVYGRHKFTVEDIRKMTK